MLEFYSGMSYVLYKYYTLMNSKKERAVFCW